jgi:glycosyltransferase involved in cell wall biosynthesis
LVSVIIPAYNATPWIARAIDSVLAQTYPRVEIIVVDDGSTDGTYKYVKDAAFPRVAVYNRSNGGPAAARNYGVHASHGEFLAFLDMDDIWAPDKLSTQLAAIEGIPGWGLCVTRSIKFLSDQECPSFGKPRRQPGITYISHRRLLYDRWGLFRKNQISTCSTALVRRDVFDKIGGFDEDAKLFGVDDYDLYLKISRHWKVVMVKAPLVGYQITPGSISRNKFAIQMNAREVLAKWADAYPDKIPKLIHARNQSLIRKLLRAGREDEAYAFFANPAHGKKRSDRAFHRMASICRIHNAIHRDSK